MIAFAYLVLFTYPIVVAILLRTLPLKLAVIWAIVAGYLILPSDFEVYVDLPALPPIDKRMMPAVAVGLLASIVTRAADPGLRARRTGALAAESPPPVVLPGWLPGNWLVRVLLLMLFGGLLMTAFTNGDWLVYGDLSIQALGGRDSISMVVEAALLILPMLIGRKYLADDEGHRLLLVVIAVAALAYSFLALFEVRMSPQINSWIYGFFPHSWLQHIRGGGFRPLVFMNHGLLLGMFTACAMVATAVLVRLDGRLRVAYLAGLLWLLPALYLYKTLAAFMIALAFVPLALLLPVRLQLLAAAIAAGITLTYPILRGSHLIPTDDLVVLAEAQFGSDRAGSLAFRFDNEDALLAKASERPAFGWGGWGRARIYDEEGRDLSTTDGAWVILIGEKGWVGYLAQFGLLTLPMILFALRRGRYRIGLATSGLCLVVAANLLDLLPNASVSPVLWLMAGALIGRLEPAALPTREATLAP
ncbi:MAG: hypothetical protein AAF698_00595, partial [Pseudomonadota bacterium]